MPINDEGCYEAPASAEVTECGCAVQGFGHNRGVHTTDCPASAEMEVALFNSLPMGATFTSFVHEMEAGGADGTVSLASLLCAVLEEQRTANLVAIASDVVYTPTVRDRARSSVLERLGLDDDSTVGTDPDAAANLNSDQDLDHSFGPGGVKKKKRDWQETDMQRRLRESRGEMREVNRQNQLRDQQQDRGMSR